MLYVDDRFVDREDAAALDYVEEKITERYAGCTRHDGDVLPFLGVMMDFTKRADMLTKPLQGELFKKFRAWVLNLPSH